MPTVIVRKDRKEGPTKMSVQERESLEEREEHFEEQLKLSKSSSSHLVKDTSVIQREHDQVREALERDADREARGKEKDRLTARNKELAHILREKVPPIWLQKARSGTPDYLKAVTAGEKANSQEVAKLYSEYQDNARRLDPDNPMAGNIGEIINSEVAAH